MEATLFLRLFVEVDTEASALEIDRKVISLISKFVSIESQSIQKYWKIPEYYEIFLKLNSLYNLRDTYQEILKILASGWEQHDEYENIWNPGPGKKFALEEVKWAHLEGEGN